MRTIEVAVLSWAVLFICSLPCASESQLSRQQQMKSHGEKAAEYLKENRPDLAADEFRAILVLDPNNLDAHGNLGAILFFQGAYADAIPELRAALKLQPNLWKTLALLGIGEQRTGEMDAGRRDLEKAFPNLREENIRIQTGLALIEIYSAAGDLDKAAATIAALRKLEPTDPAILYSAYRLYSDLADESLLSLSIVDPKSARMHQALAHELAKRGSSGEAIENYRAAIKLDPNIPGIHFELAEMLSTVGTPESKQEAETEYKAAIAANSRDEQSECRLGEIALRANDLKSASEHYTRAVELQPNDPEANVGLAKVLMSFNQPQQAETLLRHAVQVDPTNPVAHFRLSTIYRQSGRLADAKREVDEYQKYNKMKEQLRELYHDLHRSQTRDENDSPM